MSSLLKDRPGIRPLLQPKDGGETARKENSFNRSKSHNPLSIGGIISINPPKGPLSFLLNSRECFYCVEQPIPLFPVLDVGVDKEAVHLTVDVLYGNLEPIETPCLGNLNFLHESFYEILIYNAVRCSEER